MPRYIDADLMIADIQKYLCANCSIHCNPTKVKNSACDIAECLRRVDNAPTADVEPVRHGRWVKFTDYVVMCSECGRCEKRLLALSYPYCHCGAKMDESERISAEAEEDRIAAAGIGQAFNPD